MTDIAAVVAAAASSRGIGAGGNLVWRLPADMSHFKHVTMTPPSTTPSSSTATTEGHMTNAVIMGRKTWESIPSKFRPLDNRMNVILTRSESYSASSNDDSGTNPSNVMICSSLKEAIEKLKKQKDVGHVFVIGGGEIYREGIESGLVNKVIYTMVNNLSQEQQDSFDTWFPELNAEEWTCSPFPGQELEKEGNTEEEKKSSDDNDSNQFHDNAIVHTDVKTGIKYQFLEYCRKVTPNSEKTGLENTQEGADVNPEEMQYLHMCRDIIENGVERGDRTGTGTLSKFGTQMRFSLRDGTLPLLTTKRTFWRGVAEELLWFVQVRS